MRILFISDFGFDLLVQSLLSGLVECGTEVVQYPCNPIYHGGIEIWNRDGIRFFVEAKPPDGFPPVDDPLEQDLGRNLHTLAPQGPQVQYTRLFGNKISEESDMIRLLRDLKFDFAAVVIGYTRSRQALIAASRLSERGLLPPVVLVDFSKGADLVRWEVAIALRSEIVFKNIVINKKNGAIPLPLSSPIAGKGVRFMKSILGEEFERDAPKEYEIHCNLSPTYPLRAELSDAIETLCKKHGWRRAPAGAYGENLIGVHKSKIAFSMRGSELDTLHYWEIPSFRTLMFADGTMGAIHPYRFEDKKTAVFYDPNDLSGLETLLVRYLSDDSERTRIAKAGYRHCARRHSNKARAAYFLEIIKTKLAGKERVA